MSRSAKDATRFTATVPHAYTKASTNPPRIPRGNNGGASGGYGSNETPQERVARLRAEYDAKKLAKFSLWDRIVVRGRRIADSSHRIVVTGLVGLTVLAGGVTIFSLSDMILHNRRKRKIYFEEQTKLRQERIVEAQAAAAAGTADQEQILLLNQEKAKEEAAEAKKNKWGRFKKFSKTIFGTESLKKEDTVHASSRQEYEEGVSSETKEEAAQLVDGVKQTLKGSSILQAVEGKRRGGEKQLERRGVEGGSLDQMASDAATAASEQSRSWFSWVTRG